MQAVRIELTEAMKSEWKDKTESKEDISIELNTIKETSKFMRIIGCCKIAVNKRVLIL